MPNENEKQLTAMSTLRNKLQYELLHSTNKWRKELCRQIIENIDATLLATERQRLIDFYNLGRDDKTAAHIDAGEDYFRKTFKTQ